MVIHKQPRGTVVGRPRTVPDEAILLAAERAIGRYGPTRLTLARVAAAVGLAPATLLQRFGSKQGLLLAVAARGADAVGDAFSAARVSHPAPLAALRSALTRMIAGIDSPDTLANHLAFLHLDLTDPALRTQTVRHSRALREQIQRLLDEATVAGDLVRSDTDRLARAVYSTYSGALLTWAIDGQGTLGDWLGDELDLLLAPYRRPPMDAALGPGGLADQRKPE